MKHFTNERVKAIIVCGMKPNSYIDSKHACLMASLNSVYTMNKSTDSQVKINIRRYLPNGEVYGLKSPIVRMVDHTVCKFLLVDYIPESVLANVTHILLPSLIEEIRFSMLVGHRMDRYVMIRLVLSVKIRQRKSSILVYCRPVRDIRHPDWLGSHSTCEVRLPTRQSR